MKKVIVSLVCLLVVTSSTNASLLLSDDFDGGPASGAVTTTGTGQTWGVGEAEYNTLTSIDGTQGAGASVSWDSFSSTTFTLSVTGLLRLEADIIGSRIDSSWQGAGQCTGDQNKLLSVTMLKVNYFRMGV